jgi:hypothetical protein
MTLRREDIVETDGPERSITRVLVDPFGEQVQLIMRLGRTKAVDDVLPWLNRWETDQNNRFKAAGGQDGCWKDNA